VFLQPPILPPIAASAAGTPTWLCMPKGVPEQSSDATHTPPGSERIHDSSSEAASPHSTVPNTPALSAMHMPTCPARLGARVPNLVQSADDGDSDAEEISNVSSSEPSRDADISDSESSMQESKNTPVYTGVSRSGLNGRWRAQLSTRGRTVHLGTFASAEEAAQAWDRAAVQERGKAAVTNFALSDYINSDGSVKTEVESASQSAKGQREDECNSRGHKSFRGVYHSGTYGRWKARIVVKGHKIHLGTFASAEDAARAWDLKALEYRGAGTVTNFDPASYAAGTVSAPLQVDAADSDDEDKGGQSADRKRSFSNDCASPSHSDLSDRCTPRAQSDSTSKRRKHPDAHSSPRSAKGTAEWDFLGQEEEERRAKSATRQDQSSKDCARISSQDEHAALASLLSLCAAAEAMS